MRLRLIAEAFHERPLDAARDGGEGDRKVKRACHLEQPIERRGRGDGIVVAPPDCDGPAFAGGAAEHIVERRPIGTRRRDRGTGRPAGQFLDQGDGSFGAVEPDLRSRRRPARKLHPDAFGEGRGRELGFRQKPGEAERGETFGAQALLGLVAGLERHQHGRDPGAQKIDGGVVAGLAHRDRGSRQQRPEVRTGALDGDMGGRGAAEILERRLRDAGADDDAPRALRHGRGGSERRAV